MRSGPSIAGDRALSLSAAACFPPGNSSRVLTWNGLSSGRAVLFRGVCGQGVGRFDELSRRPTSGSGGGCYAPSRRAGRVGGGRGGWCRTRRHHVDRLSATLTCAGRNRSVFMRRWLPHTVHADDRPGTVVRRTTRGSVPAEAVADASCDRARMVPRADRRGTRAAVMVRRSFRPTRTRRVRGRPRWRRWCDGLCGRRGAGTVHTGGPGRSKPERSRQARRLRDAVPVRD